MTSHSKPYEIAEQEVVDAWHRVKRNGGSGGVDGVSLEQFEEKLQQNLYKLWNRMSSGSYFPKAVRRVEIPKRDGTTRPLGIPTIFDRVAQEVVRARLEEVFEPKFHKNSYGFRPGKSAHQAVNICRQRNFDYAWTIDLDIEKCFDTIDHELLLKAVIQHAPEQWMALYVERWLKSEVLLPSGERMEPKAGTPQGGVISPLLANIFLHYVFDMWISRTYPAVRFERYADDIVIHCRTRQEAEELLESCIARFESCHLRLHPEKTHVVYNQDSYRQDNGYPITGYSFLGFDFRPRRMSSKKSGRRLTRFLPGVGSKAKKHIRKKLKAKLHRRTLLQSPKEVSSLVNEVLGGWYNYFSPFSSTFDLLPIAHYVKLRFTNWLQRKYRWSRRRAARWLRLLLLRVPDFLALPRSLGSYGWIGGAV